MGMGCLLAFSSYAQVLLLMIVIFAKDCVGGIQETWFCVQYPAYSPMI
jgi:hypothetical protein